MRLIIKAMLTEIQELLVRKGRQKAKDIAATLFLDKHELNQTLYLRTDLFVRDDSYAWSLTPEACLDIPIGNRLWITSRDFENALPRAGSPLASNAHWVVFSYAAKSAGRVTLRAAPLGAGST